MNRRFLSPLVALALVLPISTWAASTLTRGPYLQQSTSNTIVVVWRTEGAINPVLRYGNSPKSLTRELKGNTITLRVSADVQAPASVPRLYQEPPEDTPRRGADHDPSTAPNTHQYEARVDGLPPKSRHYYAVYDGDRKLVGGDADHYFVTHSPIGTESDLRLWIVGDSGTGEVDQKMVHDSMRAYVARNGRGIDHYIHVGDMAYSDGTDREFQETFFAPYQATLRNTVCWPSMGNHEGHTSRGISGFGPYYDAYVVPTKAEAGGVASGTEAYYSFDIADIHFICLDSHDLDRGTDAPMARWLRADLERTRAKWLIAFWHHPPYTKGSHDSDRESQLIEMRENFMPILEAAGVDLTLTGHSHIYERSMLIDGAYATPTTARGVILDDRDGNPDGNGPYLKSAGLNPHEGSIAIVAGHGGAGLGREGTMPIMRQIILEHGSVILDIKGDTLKGIMLNRNGETRDLFSLVKRGKVTPKRVENPWQPVHDITQLTEIRLEFATAAAGAMPEGWRQVQGDRTSVVFATDKSGRQKWLSVRSQATPVVALYDAFKANTFEFEAQFRFPAGHPGGAGLVFGYVDDRNYGRVLIDAAGLIRVSRFVNGTETLLGEKKVTISAGEWYNLGLETDDDVLQVQIQDDEERQAEVEFDVKLGAAIPSGPLGFHVPANSAVEFHHFVIEK